MILVEWVFLALTGDGEAAKTDGDGEKHNGCLCHVTVARSYEKESLQAEPCVIAIGQVVRSTQSQSQESRS